MKGNPQLDLPLQVYVRVNGEIIIGDKTDDSPLAVMTTKGDIALSRAHWWVRHIHRSMNKPEAADRAKYTAKDERLIKLGRFSNAADDIVISLEPDLDIMRRVEIGKELNEHLLKLVRESGEGESNEH